jgi:signal transduction histidine kinase
LDKWYDVNAIRIGDPSEYLVAILFEDITAKKKALTNLALSEEKLSLALDIAELGLFEINLLNNTVTVKRAQKKRFGEASNPIYITLKELENYFHPDDKNLILDELDKAFDPAGPGEFNFERRVARKDGAVRWIRAMGRTFFDTVEGEVKAVRCIGSYLDTTAQKEESMQLENYMRKLELANDRLGESNQRLDDFVHIVSHDLKEPVRGIYNFSTFLLEDYKDKLGDGEEDLRTLKNLSMRMNDLIDDLQKYARIGKEEAPLEDVDLNKMVSDVLELMKIQINKDKVSISVNGGLPTVRCSKAHLAEVFRNLIVNAIKYNKSSPKKIDIGYLQNHPRHPGGRVFFVKDNGIGIEEKHREVVFKIFRRLHGRDEYGGGTGSRLAIVKKLVEQHKGEVWIESNPEGGSIFLFYVNCA